MPAAVPGWRPTEARVQENDTLVTMMGANVSRDSRRRIVVLAEPMSARTMIFFAPVSEMHEQVLSSMSCLIGFRSPSTGSRFGAGTTVANLTNLTTTGYRSPAALRTTPHRRRSRAAAVGRRGAGGDGRGEPGARGPVAAGGAQARVRGAVGRAGSLKSGTPDISNGRLNPITGH